MFIERIRLKNFRNIDEAVAYFCPHVNVFFGENAQGKTNFIESIYTSIHGTSFRTTDSKKLIQENESVSAVVEMSVEKKNLKYKLSTQISSHEKKVILNEKKVSKSTIRNEFSTVLFSPESLGVIKNSDRERRDLVDELVENIFPQKRKTLESYRRLLRQRNTFLKDLKEHKRSLEAGQILLLETLTQQYLECSAELVETRLLALQKLLPKMINILRSVFDEGPVDIAVDYVISDQAYSQISKTEAHDAMYKRWLQLKAAEIKLGHSLVGPHKHDICLLFNKKDSRHYCSQGQQRLLILAFKMAQIGLHYDVHGTYPILLLDDVLSEIDERRRIRLIEELESLRAQIFITTTENTVLRYLHRTSYSVFEVQKGKIFAKTGQQEEMSVR